MKHLILMGSVTLSLICGEARSQDPISSAAGLEILQSITASMYRTDELHADSCIHIVMNMTSVPKEGSPMVQHTELFNGPTRTSFKSDLMEEHISAQEMVRIWPSENRVMIVNNTGKTLSRTFEVMEAANELITKNAKVTKIQQRTAKNGTHLLLMDMQLNMPSLGGVVTQKVELDLDLNTIRTSELVMPAENPLRSFKVQYLVHNRVRMPKKDPFVSGLIAMRGPVKEYKGLLVTDLRTKK